MDQFFVMQTIYTIKIIDQTNNGELSNKQIILSPVKTGSTTSKHLSMKGIGYTDL